MSADVRCAVDLVGGANGGVFEAIAPAREMMGKGTVTDLGQFVVGCEQCKANFTVIAEPGNPAAMFLIEEPAASVDEDVCVEVASKKPREWVTNVSRQWFDVTVIEPAKPKTREGVVIPEVSTTGVNIVIDDIAGNSQPEGNLSEADQQRIKDMDTYLTLPNGRSWQELVLKRVADNKSKDV